MAQRHKRVLCAAAPDQVTTKMLLRANLTQKDIQTKIRLELLLHPSQVKDLIITKTFPFKRSKFLTDIESDF